MSILLHPKWSAAEDDPGETLEAVDRQESPAGRATDVGSSPSRRPSVWREQVRSRLADLSVELNSLPAALKSDAWREDARHRLDEAAAIVSRTPSLHSGWTGVDVEGTWMRIHAIEVALVRLSPPEIVRAKLPGIIADGAQLLGEDHPRVKILRAYQKQPDWDGKNRECLAHSVRAVYEEADKENVRLRSFRNILFGATIALAALAIGFAVFGLFYPDAIERFSSPSNPETLTQASRSAPAANILAIEMLGLISASLVGAVAIRRMKGTSVVYGVPMASLLLKLPMGALTALAGILMIRAGIGGLQEAGYANWTAYALLFGASQQGFTGLIDRQAHNVLDHVTSKDNG
jgi:hypothetical protein